MTKNENPNQRAVIVAAAAASLLILISGISYRVLAARLEASGHAAPISPAALKRFSLQIGGWTGQEVPLDEAIVRATDTDAHLNRRYSRHGGLESISLYVASGVRARDLMPHRPEVCYTGAGWTLMDRRSMELPLSDGTKLPVNVFEFSRGTLNKKKIVVLDYYIVDGQYCRDVSLLRSKAWRGSGLVRSVAQIQIVASITANLTADSAEKIVCAFAVESESAISGLFTHSEESRDSDKESFYANSRLLGGNRGG